MKVEIRYVHPVRDSVLPRISFDLYINYQVGEGIPFFKTGQLKLGNKYLSRLDIDTENARHNTTRLELWQEKDDPRKNEGVRIKLYTEFSERVVQFIEDVRTTNQNRNVSFQLELIFETFKRKRNTAEPGNVPDVEIKQEVETIYHEVEQSEWIRNYSEIMGTGKFLLFEYPVIQPVVGDAFSGRWKEILNRAQLRLDEMQQELKEGQWARVIESSRKVFDNFKFSKKNKEDREELKQLFEGNNYSDEGVNDFLDSIWSIHEFASKFPHDKPKKTGPEGYLNPIPIAQKEDAYFIYSLAVGLVNMLGMKVNEMNRRARKM